MIELNQLQLDSRLSLVLKLIWDSFSLKLVEVDGRWLIWTSPASIGATFKFEFDIEMDYNWSDMTVRIEFGLGGKRLNGTDYIGFDC